MKEKKEDSITYCSLPFTPAYLDETGRSKNINPNTRSLWKAEMQNTRFYQLLHNWTKLGMSTSYTQVSNNLCISVGWSFNQIKQIIWFWNSQPCQINRFFLRDMEDATDMISILLFDPLMISGLFYTSENPTIIFILYIKILFSYGIKIGLRK